MVKVSSTSIQEKLKVLQEFFKGKKVIIAFSGGVDSTTIAVLAKSYAKEVLLVTRKNEFIQTSELKKAIYLAKKYDLPLFLVENEILFEDKVKANPINRCYYCKLDLSHYLKRIKEEKGFDIIVEGTNTSDLKLDHRPGYQAIQENSIFSPFVLADISKKEVRMIAKELGIEIWNDPPMACLASRIKTGTIITKEKLKRVELAEEFLIEQFKLSLVRVRDNDNEAMIEVLPHEIQKLLKANIDSKIVPKFAKLGFEKVIVNLEGYKLKE